MSESGRDRVGCNWCVEVKADTGVLLLKTQGKANKAHNKVGLRRQVSL